MTGAFDVVVVGAGMAGASAAALLAEHMKVLLLEAESRPGYHSTGRSAATFIENYGAPLVRQMTRASRAFYEEPPDGFADGPLVSPRGLLYTAAEDELALLEEEISASQGMQRLGREEIIELVPALGRGPVAAAGYEPGAQDMDVDRIHQGFLRRARRAGCELRCDHSVSRIERHTDGWRLHAGGERIDAPLLVNAAGAWGDRVAEMAGVPVLGLQPYRRSVAIVEVGDEVAVDPAWPLVAGVAGDWYCKAEGQWLLVSPANEDPSDPCDAYPEDLELAEGIDRMQRACGFEVKRMQRSWAGLRTFAPDRLLVNGFDPADERFYWLVGQGGYGIQTAPAMAMAAAANLVEAALPRALEDAGVQAEALSPARLRG